MLLFLHCGYLMLAMSIGLLQGRPSMSPLTTWFYHQRWLLHIIGTLCSSFVDWIIWCIKVNFCLYLLLVFSKNKKAQMWESCVIADVAGYITQEGQRKVKQMWCHQLMFWSVHTPLLRMVQPSSSSFSCDSFPLTQKKFSRTDVCTTQQANVEACQCGGFLQLQCCWVCRILAEAWAVPPTSRP